MRAQASIATFLLALLAASPANAAMIKNLPTKVRACTAEDLAGLYKLRNVFEPEAGTLTRSFQQAPHQYVFFRKNQSYAEVKGSLRYPAPKDLEPVLVESLLNTSYQFVLGANGALYFYDNRKHTQTFTCWKMKEKQGRFLKNDMLLIQPLEGGSKFNLHWYQKHDFSAQNNNNQNKKRKKKRKKPRNNGPLKPL